MSSSSSIKTWTRNWNLVVLSYNKLLNHLLMVQLAHHPIMGFHHQSIFMDFVKHHQLQKYSRIRISHLPTIIFDFEETQDIIDQSHFSIVIQWCNYWFISHFVLGDLKPHFIDFIVSLLLYCWILSSLHPNLNHLLSHHFHHFKNLHQGLHLIVVLSGHHRHLLVLLKFLLNQLDFHLLFLLLIVWCPLYFPYPLLLAHNHDLRRVLLSSLAQLHLIQLKSRSSPYPQFLSRAMIWTNHPHHYHSHSHHHLHFHLFLMGLARFPKDHHLRSYSQHLPHHYFALKE